MIFDSLTHLNAEAAACMVQGTVLVQVSRKTEKTTRTGKPYLEVQFSDAGGTVALKAWDNAPHHPAFRALAEGDTTAITARWQLGEFGMDAADIDLRPLTPEEEEALFAGGAEMAQRQQADWQSIVELVGSMSDPRLAALSQGFLASFEGRFRRAAAARGYHHARRGGLVEHTAGVMRVAAALCSAYPQLNRDLLLAGALFHDCGKMWENSYPDKGLTMPYSDAGELLGHITLGIEVINRLWGSILTPERQEEWAALTPGNDQVRLHLLHLIAAHHGELEYGSPVVPKTPEALALNHADNIDAKMEMFRSAYETSPALAARIRQRKAPLPGNVVAPLPVYRQGMNNG